MSNSELTFYDLVRDTKEAFVEDICSMVPLHTEAMEEYFIAIGELEDLADYDDGRLKNV
jgi:hypothetical protein